jgi:hypothetical protein
MEAGTGLTLGRVIHRRPPRVRIGTMLFNIAAWQIIPAPSAGADVF